MIECDFVLTDRSMEIKANGARVDAESHKQAVVEYSQQEMMVLCARVMKGWAASSEKRWSSGCNLKVQLTRFLQDV